MKKIAVIHTVPSVYASFPALIKENVSGAVVTNTVDEFLSSDAIARGEFTANNLNRLYFLLRCAEMTAPDAIVLSCSTLTQGAAKLRPLISVPIVTIDGLMLREAVAKGAKITVLATAICTVQPAKEGLAAEAAAIGLHADIDSLVSDEAFVAIKRLEKEKHDRLVKEAAAGIKNRDVIVLAQASMSHLEEDIAKQTGIPTLSSPRFCMTELKRVLGV